MSPFPDATLFLRRHFADVEIPHQQLDEANLESNIDSILEEILARE